MLNFYLLLKKFIINSLFKWGLVLIILSKRWISVMIKFTDRKRSLYLKSFLILLLKVSIAFLSLLESCNMINMIMIKNMLIRLNIKDKTRVEYI